MIAGRMVVVMFTPNTLHFNLALSEITSEGLEHQVENTELGHIIRVRPEDYERGRFLVKATLKRVKVEDD